MTSLVESAVEDRRLLLRHALQDYSVRGGQIVLPVGSSGFDEDWLLDALDVPHALELIKANGRLDLIALCSHSDAFVTRLPNGTLNASTVADAARAARSLPSLQLPSMTVEIDERDLQIFSFQIFCFSCGTSSSPALIQNLRAQLEISEALGTDLCGVVRSAQQAGLRSIATVDAVITLLEAVRPSAFQSFRSFVSWRNSVASVALRSLEHAAARDWAQKDGGGGAPARILLVGLKGSLRRLDVRDQEDFEEAEYSAAAKGVAHAAGRILASCRSASPPLPLGIAIQVAELLLRGQFDPLDEGQLASEAPELLRALTSALWPQLRVTQHMHSALSLWVYFRQYLASQEEALLRTGAQMARSLGGGNQAGARAGQDGAVIQAILAAVSVQTAVLLSDYHATYPSAGEMRTVLDFLAAVEGARGAEGKLERTLARCIADSVGSAFARRAGEVQSQAPLEEDCVALLATEGLALLHLERATYVPALSRHQPAAAAIVAVVLHELYGAKLMPWIVSLPAVTKSVAATVHAAVGLEEELLAEVQVSGRGAVKPPEPWSAVERVTPLLTSWATSQVGTLRGWLDRIMSKEDWTPVVEQRGATSRSAVETLKVMEDAVDALFGMGLAVPGSVVRALVEGIDGQLQRYCILALAEVGSADALVPPNPPLTRYKKELADAAESVPVSGARVKAVTSKVNAALGTSWPPPLPQEVKDRVLGLPYDALVVRANSLHFMGASVADLESMILVRWAAAQAEAGSVGGGDTLRPGLLAGAQAATAEAVDHLLQFAALKLICGDLRVAVFKELYALHVDRHRLRPVLEEVDAALGTLCEMLSEGMSARMAGHACKTLSAAVRQVLLDGGPHRLFAQADAPLLAQDLQQLEAMFYAEGAGLESDMIARLCGPLAQVVAAMRLDTPTLITACKGAKASPLRQGPATPEGRQRGGSLDPDVVLRVLCHRADYDASKYLKKEFKISKKLPNVMSKAFSSTSSSRQRLPSSP